MSYAWPTVAKARTTRPTAPVAMTSQRRRLIRGLIGTSYQRSCLRLAGSRRPGGPFRTGFPEQGRRLHWRFVTRPQSVAGEVSKREERAEASRDTRHERFDLKGR